MKQRMKYIVIDGPLMVEIYIFPDYIKHNDLAMRFDRPVISAGFIGRSPELLKTGFTENPLICYGESVSLNIESRNEIDTALLMRVFS